MDGKVGVAASLDALPSDVLLQIFSNTDARALTTLACCCQNTRHVAFEPSLWRSLLRSRHWELLGKDGIDPYCSLLPSAALNPRGSLLPAAMQQSASWPHLFFANEREWLAQRTECLSFQRERIEPEIFGNGEQFEQAWREALDSSRRPLLNIGVLLRLCMISKSLQTLMWALTAVLGALIASATAFALISLREAAVYMSLLVR